MFRKAERKKAKLRLGILGPSGSGKTYSAILITKGLGGKVALIDTENGSGELYSHLMDYDVATLTAPFSPEKYIQLIHGAEQAGYNALIIDSLSHAWSGDGGVLDMHDKATAATRNSFTAWREVTPQHNALVDAILQSPLHIIATMRTKTAYEVSQDNGKTKVVKVGLAPIQPDGMEYEFTAVFDLSIDGHIATASKDRTTLYDGKHFKPSVETGKELLEWLESGVDGDAISKAAVKDMIERISKIENIFELKNWWKKHQLEIEALQLVDRTLVVSAKDTRKTELEQAGNGKKQEACLPAGR
jgi:hypothetical protein